MTVVDESLPKGGPPMSLEAEHEVEDKDKVEDACGDGGGGSCRGCGNAPGASARTRGMLGRRRPSHVESGRGE